MYQFSGFRLNRIMLPIDSCIVLASVLLAITAQEWTKINCPAPRSPTNGMSFIFENGQRVQFHCHPGFQMVGKNLAECKRNRWSSPPPRCIPLNASPSDIETKVAYDMTCIEKSGQGQNFIWAPTIHGSHVKQYIRSKNSSYPFNYYVVAIYDCKPGYTLENMKNSKLYCQKKRWVGTYPRCIPIDSLRQPCNINNGGCHHICTFVQGKVHCSCRPSYVIASDGKSCQRYLPWNNNDDIQGDDSRERQNQCKVNNGGCSQQCHTVDDKAVCSCFRGFKLSQDEKNCIDIDECLINNGGCEGLCQNFAGSHICRCPQGYKLAADRRTCQDENECLRNNGHGPCSDKCRNIKGSFICSCTIRGTILGADNITCEDIDECKEDNFGCSHNCTNSYGNAFCSCPQGYQLGDDDKTCIDYNECEIPEFAERCEGRCINEVGTYKCEDTQALNEPTTPFPTCGLGYHIDDNGRCEDIDECQDRSIHRCHYQCVNTEGSFYCTCPDGYLLSSDGICEDVDECKNNSLGCSHKCQNVAGSAHCICSNGYRLSHNRKDCLDIDECEKERIHKCHHKCINTAGSFHCVCSPGYVMTINGVCKGCEKNSYLSEERDVCVNCPDYSHTDTIGMTSISDCVCNDGFIGNLTIEDSCTDIDECKINNGECSNNCVNTPGSFHCTCPLGYSLDKDEKTCIDTDECSLNKGGCHQGCVNTVGSFKCTCSDGYVVPEFNQFTCTDIDECLYDNGGCSHNCVNYDGGYYCTCKRGYRLSSDFRSCVEISCKELPAPHRGKIHCSSPSRDRTVPMNTTCQITCIEGHKSDGGTELTCGMNGDWSEPLPSCVSLFCPQLRSPENGDVHPPGCLTGSMGVFEKCFFTCHTGYRLVGRASTKCIKDLKWRPPKMPKCEKYSVEPFIQCPSDITVILEPHQNSRYVRIPKPKSNMDPKHIEVYPKWIDGMEANFPAGVTEIQFIAKHPSKNLTASCRVVVNVEDKEPPVVSGCPGDIALYADSVDPVEVTWEEPIFKDNVEVQSVSQNQKSGNKFTAGAHMVHYTAVDTSRNIAKCVFTVKILRKECGEPRDFLHGEKNCMDLLTARFCEPICDPGFAFFGNVSDFYMCGADGIWVPSEEIPDCSPFITEPEDGCLPGTEFREEADTGSRICVACLQGMYWDAETSSCSPCPVGSYQDEYGRTSCKSCTEAERTNPLCEKST